MPSPRPRCSGRTPSTEIQPALRLAWLDGRPMVTPSRCSPRPPPRSRATDRQSPDAPEPVQPLLERSRREPQWSRERRLDELVEQRLVDALHGRRGRRRPPATPATNERFSSSIAHPVRRPDGPVAPLLEQGLIGDVVRSSATALTTPTAARRSSARALELGVHLGQRLAANVEPENSAVVRLIADVAVADDRAVPNRDDDVRARGRTAAAASTTRARRPGRRRRPAAQDARRPR